MQYPPPIEATSQQTYLTPRVDPEAIDWAMGRLRPPTASQLRLAHSVGLDPNLLLEQLNEAYDAACSADSALIDELTGDDQSCGPLYGALWDQVNEIAEDHHDEWWIAPLQEVARILGATSQDIENMTRGVRASGRVGYIVRSSVIARRPGQHRSRPAPRAREHRPGGARRAASSSTSSGCDPGDPDAAKPPAARLTLPPPPEAIMTFGFAREVDQAARAEVRIAGRRGVFIAERCEVTGPWVHVTGRWRTRKGGHGFYWSEERSYTWPPRQVLSVRYVESEVAA